MQTPSAQTLSTSIPMQPLTETALQTLHHSVQLSGLGLHSGARITVHLCPRAERGFVFVRADLPAAPVIPASWRYITRTIHATTLEKDGAAISTTEHLLAALWAMNVTNCQIEINGPEIPILDGSALDWCRLIESAGLTQGDKRPIYTLREPVWVTEGQGSVLALPHHELRVTVAVDYGAAFRQCVDLALTPSGFASELAPARTFTREEWIAPLRKQGLIRGGSVDNAIILQGDETSVPLRFPNELARHKALDLVGDIALLCGEDGGALQAHFIALRAGHGLHCSWMQECLRRNALIQHDA